MPTALVVISVVTSLTPFLVTVLVTLLYVYPFIVIVSTSTNSLSPPNGSISNKEPKMENGELPMSSISVDGVSALSRNF